MSMLEFASIFLNLVFALCHLFFDFCVDGDMVMSGKCASIGAYWLSISMYPNGGVLSVFCSMMGAC